MTGRNSILSIAMGILTPFPLLVLFNLFESGAVASQSPTLGPKAALAAAFLFALAVALFRPIHPVLYGVVLAPSFPVADLVLFSGGNLAGLAFLIFLQAGVIIGGATALCGWWIKRRTVPAWAPAAAMLGACAVLVFGQANAARQADQGGSEILEFLHTVGAAEDAYSAACSDHAYTCNGPDLTSVTGIEWRTDRNFGGENRNQGEHGKYWITLRCQPFQITAQALWPGGPRYVYDGATGVIAPETPVVNVK